MIIPIPDSCILSFKYKFAYLFLVVMLYKKQHLQLLNFYE